MTPSQLFILAVVLVLVIALCVLLFVLLRSGNKSDHSLRNLMGSSHSLHEGSGDDEGEMSAEDKLVAEVLEKTKAARAKSSKDEVANRLFRAGYYSQSDRAWFNRLRIVIFVLCVVIIPLAVHFLLSNPGMTATSALMAAFIGYAIPMSWLERKMREREEDIMYFLPLAIEQISIGVSSALDVGPCISNIIELSYERGSHNSVTEMFVHVEKLVRSGLNLEDALQEVGAASGVSEVKHAFMFLAQCARHGGEITKQLQELADTVMMQRQVTIEAKIASLPVKATGPLTLVFAGFFALLLAGLVVRLVGAFGRGV